ncbi:sporulation histidine kinase inhibitor Sda [Bacillus pinisoli]|uniref:sporulation histidine kinase inhibitor Sda n=1 Tax=Bacillus pinisoli TaxID=2901866 RepID=UPI001FF60148|nr:sporulation histidine kinase inhibitor Sda [Bacillus pinisoli]
MNQLTDKQLMEAYLEAINLDLEEEFINTLKSEINRRCINKKSQEEFSGLYLLIRNK